jgi:ParB-like nuclease domain
MTGIGKDQARIERQARLRWVPLSRMRVNPLAQRDLNSARVAKLAAVFDPEKMDTPTVNYRGGWYYLIDGQHRIAALKQWLSCSLAGPAGAQRTLLRQRAAALARSCSPDAWVGAEILAIFGGAR